MTWSWEESRPRVSTTCGNAMVPMVSAIRRASPTRNLSFTISRISAW